MFMWKWPLCSHRPFSLTFGHCQIFEEYFAYMWLEIWNSVHTRNAWWLAYCVLHILAWEFVEMLNYSVLSIQWVTRAFHLFSMWIWLVKCLFGKINMAFSCASLPSVVIILKSTKLFVLIFSPRYSSSPMFQDPRNKSHFNIQTCPWKFHNQHWVNCTQNNPFIGLGR